MYQAIFTVKKREGDKDENDKSKEHSNKAVRLREETAGNPSVSRMVDFLNVQSVCEHVTPRPI